MYGLFSSIPSKNKIAKKMTDTILIDNDSYLPRIFRNSPRRNFTIKHRCG